MGKKFAKNKENFVCEHCRHENIGNGYTNHCQNCLWSKHVDVNPGDRESLCMGPMKPWKVIGSTGRGAVESYSIIHKCTVCGHEKTNKLTKGDSEDALWAIIKKNAENL